MIKKLILPVFLLTLLFSTSAAAEIKMRKYGGITYVDESTVAELETIFKKYNYQRFRALDDNSYPAIIVRKIPSDYQNIRSQKYRNELFIRMLTPLALKINEEISNERYTLLRINRHWQENKKLSEADHKKLEQLAQKYDYFTQMDGDKKIILQLQNLDLRINIIPPSILVSTAAIESNWGDSRIVLEANSLYKEKVWYTKEGLEPLENKDDGYRFKIFNSLIESMRSFALNFNSNIKYSVAWYARKKYSERHETLLGESLAYSTAGSADLPNFAGILDYTSTFYDLIAIDMGKLKRDNKDDIKNNADPL